MSPRGWFPPSQLATQLTMLSHSLTHSCTQPVVPQLHPAGCPTAPPSRLSHSPTQPVVPQPTQPVVPQLHPAGCPTAPPSRLSHSPTHPVVPQLHPACCPSAHPAGCPTAPPSRLSHSPTQPVVPQPTHPGVPIVQPRLVSKRMRLALQRQTAQWKRALPWQCRADPRGPGPSRASFMSSDVRIHTRSMHVKQRLFLHRIQGLYGGWSLIQRSRVRVTEALVPSRCGLVNENASQHCVARAPLTASIKMVLMLTPGPQNDTYAGLWVQLTD